MDEPAKDPYTIKEAALIFESGSAELLDYVIGVYAPSQLRIKRTMERNHLGDDEVKQRMDKQLDESMKMKLCDFVIDNDEEHLLIPQVMERIRNSSVCQVNYKHSIAFLNCQFKCTQTVCPPTLLKNFPRSG